MNLESFIVVKFTRATQNLCKKCDIGFINGIPLKPSVTGQYSGMRYNLGMGPCPQKRILSHSQGRQENSLAVGCKGEFT